MTNDQARVRLAVITEGLPPSFWPDEARALWSQLWRSLKEAT